ncbi:peptide-N-glycosidase [Flavobacterium sediminis]|uniref:Peptide-N-glycosidase n=1 Tax=Flavobacterium sediminis TaxID=2201181 RepID=A0A2U8QWW6_9FLAO|nr:GLPGLI family protein [Flavobacterium sediminis]AWM14285.1 peptide-N-glycosidase [Flavobacterium sediminis]
MKRFFLLLVFLSFLFSNAQHKTAYKISFSKIYNGNPIDTENPIITFATTEQCLITTHNIQTQKADFPFERTIVYPKSGEFVKMNNLSKDKTISTKDTASLAKQEFKITDEFKSILGYKCRKAETVINSNHIDIWYTTQLHINGGPSVLGQTLGLVLEINRNNNYIITAEKIEKTKNFTPLQLDEKQFVDILTYNDLVWKSRFKIIPVFEEELVRFSDEARSSDSILRFANGTIILKKIRFPEFKKGDQIFVELKEQSNGDAYDRTGSVFIIPQDKPISFLNGLQEGAKTLPIYTNGNGKEYQGVVATPEYSPLIELMRFFTPFGIHQYNHIRLKNKEWYDAVSYREEVSELRSFLSGKEFWVGCFIGNYDKGGHKISLNISIHHEETEVFNYDTVIPLFNTTNVMEMAGQEYGTMFNSEKGLLVSFRTHTKIENAVLRYTVTGHGGWENGDEFVPKANTIYLDGQKIQTLIPWRQDCGSYRLFNPASGNFANGLSSSDYSRSNWCPGTVTYPFYIFLGNLSEGEHTLQVQIPQGEPEGGSFSAWNVSGVLLGN